MDDLTKTFTGSGRVIVSDAARARIIEAYHAAGFRSSRQAAERARELGESVSHQTIESFLAGKWTTADRRVLRALIKITGVDVLDVASLNAPGPEPDEWTITLPRRYWHLDFAARERVRRALLTMLDTAAADSE